MNETKERLCVVLPVYNEQEAIEPVLRKWDSMLKSIGVDYEIRPYNDGSRDDTLAVMRKIEESLEKVSVRDKPNGGHGNTILTGYRDAAADGFDWIFQVDSDDEMGPEKFGELWARRGGYDFLVGSRDGRCQAWTRKIISFVSRICVRLFYGKSVWDVNTPYRLMRVSAFRDFYGQIPLTTFAPNVILSGLAARHKLRSFEIPVPQHDRTTGEVSIKKWKLLMAAVKSFWQTIWFAMPTLSFTKAEVLVLIFFYTITVLAYSCSPVINHPYTDSSVFVYVGRVMQNGGLPYVDVFDHKGPLLYLLNCFGLCLTGNISGIWIVECVLLLACSFCFFGCIHRLFGRTPNIIAIIGFFMLSMGTSSGNMTESWGTCFAMIILSDVMMRFHAGGHWSCRRGFFSGLSIAALALLRPNLLPVGLVYVAAVMYDCWRRSDYTSLLAVLKGVSAGACIVVFPIVYWMANTGCLAECLNSYILFNIKYLSNGGMTSSWNYIFLLLVLLYSGLAWKAERRNKDGIAALCLWVSGCAFFNWCIIALKPTHEHYYEILTPTIVILVAMACHCSEKMRRNVHVVTLCLFFAFCGFESICAMLRPWIDLNLAASSLIEGRLHENARRIFGPACNRDSASSEVLSLKPYITDMNSVTVLRNECFAYEVLKARTPWRYPYQLPIVNISKEIKQAVEELIINGTSQYIIYPKKESDFLGKQLQIAYKRIAETKNYILWKSQRQESSKQ